MRYWFCCLAVLFLSVVPLAAQAVPHLETTPCPFFIPYDTEEEGTTLECATLTVPEDHAQPDGPAIELAVLIIHSTSDTPRPDPMLYLSGGPGGAAITGYDLFLSSAFRPERDIVLVDQRGTGYSHPSLDCWEYVYATDDPSNACLKRLTEAGVNLATFNSAQSAQDVGDLISVLGYDEVNLWGASYGTRLALTTLRETKAAIRSVILDGVYPPEVAAWQEEGVNGYNAMKVLFAGCAADEICNETYPDLEAVFYETVTALDENPLPFVDDTREVTGEVFTGEDLVMLIYQNLYSTRSIPFLPAKIYEAYNNDAYSLVYEGWSHGLPGGLPYVPGVDISTVSDEDYDRMWADYLSYETPEALNEYLDTLSDDDLASLRETFEDRAADSNGALIDDNSEGFYNTVECHEEIPFNSLSAAHDLLKDAPENVQTPLLADYTRQVQFCEDWALPAASDLESDAVVSDIPTLAISGQYDPITPSTWGQSAADALTHSYHFIVPGAGHVSVDYGQACPTEIALAFLDDPDTEPDSSCLEEMGVTFYVVGED